MTKRYRETLDEVVLDDGDDVGDPGPRAFRWRGQPYTVLQVLGHWREDAGWWRRPDGVPVRIERTDLWRVEAGNRVGPGRMIGNGVPTRGVYELVRRGDTWRLDRVWD
ncbi:hypothetical protein FTX61_12325 [Nitriliruptoraceae bacterium ZYF776]|nr:hypothetical protein [Profundirhabdus halotolerans]